MARDLRAITIEVPTTRTDIAMTPRLVTIPLTDGSERKEFYFPFAPTGITYENLAPEYVEIDRPQNQAIVGLVKYKLMKVSFQFLVAKPLDGMFTSVDEELRSLREFANSKDPVAFINMDGMLTNPFNIPGLSTKRESSAFFFRIVDLSVTSVRRNIKNEITAADVSISLLEVNNPTAYVSKFLRITYPKTVSPKKKSKKKKTDGTSEGKYGKPNINIKLSRLGTR